MNGDGILKFSNASQSNPSNQGCNFAAPGFSLPNLRLCFLNNNRFIKSKELFDQS
jgi:hypothetical protein